MPYRLLSTTPHGRRSSRRRVTLPIGQRPSDAEIDEGNETGPVVDAQAQGFDHFLFESGQQTPFRSSAIEAPRKSESWEMIPASADSLGEIVHA